VGSLALKCIPDITISIGLSLDAKSKFSQDIFNFTDLIKPFVSVKGILIR